MSCLPLVISLSSAFCIVCLASLLIRQQTLQAKGLSLDIKHDSPLVEGHGGGVLAKAHDIGPARVSQHVVNLLHAVREQQRCIRLVPLHVPEPMSGRLFGEV